MRQEPTIWDKGYGTTAPPRACQLGAQAIWFCGGLHSDSFEYGMRDAKGNKVSVILCYECSKSRKELVPR